MEYDWVLLDKLKFDPWFSKLPTEFQDRLLPIGVPQKVPAGRTIFYRGDENSGMYCLLQGSVLIMNEVAPGQDGLLLQLTPTAWFGEIGVFDDGAHTHSAEADSPCSLLHFPRAPLLAILKKDPEYWQHLSKLLTTKLRLAFFAFDEFVRLPNETRLARRLLMVAAGAGHSKRFNPVIDLHQEQLAQSLGISRTTLNPILRKWADDGLITLSYGRITIDNVERFKEVAGYENWASVYKEGLGLPLISLKRNS